LITLFSREGLQWWLGSSFAAESFRILQWLAFGMLMNSLAVLSFGLVQASGRPNFTATLHMIELPAYIAVLWALIHSHGVQGAAMAWTIRVTLDNIALLWLATRQLYRRWQPAMPWLVAFACAGAVCVIASVEIAILWKFAAAVVFVVLYLTLTWAYVLDSREKEFLLSLPKLQPRSSVPSY
jgi:O-antigen/teichoic acid export membrane protein